jgi:hypothetical protein
MTGWSLLLAAVCGGAAVVAAAGLWGGAPWRQVPFILLSTLVGAILPFLIDLIRGNVTTSAPAPAVDSDPAIPTPPVDQAPKRAAEPVTLIYDIRGEPQAKFDKRTKLEVRMLMTGAVLLLLALWIDNSGAAQELSVVAGLAALIGITLTPLGLIGTLREEIRSNRAQVQLRLDAEGITLRRRRRRVALRWSEIEQLRIDPSTGYLCASTTALDRDRHRLLYQMIGRGAARSLGERAWRPSEELVHLCRPAWLTSSSRRFFEDLETLSGHEVHNKDAVGR